MRTSDSKPSSISRVGSSDITFVMMDNPSPPLAEDWIGGLTHSLLISMRSRFGYCVVSVPVLSSTTYAATQRRRCAKAERHVREHDDHGDFGKLL